MLKRITALLMILALCAGIVSCMADGTSMPSEIREYFSSGRYAGTIQESSGECANWYFVLSSDAKGQNTLVAFRKDRNGTWKYSFKTSGAVLQGRNRVAIGVSESGYQDWGTDEIISQPSLLIYQSDETDEYTEAFLAFVLRDGVWKFTRYWNLKTGATIRGYDDRLTYYRGIEDPAVRGSAYGTYERNLQYFSFSALPKTLGAAQEKLSYAPQIPAYGTLSAQEIQFTSGRKYSVYQGPGTQYGQAGNGKAAVSTNDWIQVFGEENGWILIQYDITSDHMRIGWIDSKALPRNASVKQLHFEPISAYTTEAVSMTDDPLYSRTSIGSLGPNASVILLASMGDWAYIETTSAASPIRGFVPLRSLTTSAHLTREQVVRRAQEMTGLYVEPAETSYDARTQLWTVTFLVNGEVTNSMVTDAAGSLEVQDLPNG